MKLRLSIIILFLLLLLPLAAEANVGQESLYFFHSPECGACIRIKRNYLPQIIEKYGDTIKIVSLDTTKPQALSTLISLSEKYDRRGAFVPAILIEDQLLLGTKEIKKNLESILQNEIKDSKDTSALTPVGFKQIISKFKQISPASFFTKGLVDAVNPCALAGLIFFLSFLITYGYKRKEMLYISLCYIISVFITYLLIGHGLFKFLYYNRFFTQIVSYFYYGVAIFCFLFALIALGDYFSFRKHHRRQQWILRLPPFLRNKMDKIIQIKGGRRRYLSIGWLSLLSLLAGHLISVLGGGCTGQIYLPVISFILKMPSLKSRALLYLFVYNIAFVMPLILVFLLTLIGAGSHKFKKLLHANSGLIKLMIVFVFIYLGSLVFYSATLGF